MAAEEKFGWYMYEIVGDTLKLRVSTGNVNVGAKGWDLSVHVGSHDKQGSTHEVKVVVGHHDSDMASEAQSEEASTAAYSIDTKDRILVEFTTNGGGLYGQLTVFDITVGQSPDTAFTAGGSTWP